MKRVFLGVAMLAIGVVIGASLNAWPGSAAPEQSSIVGTWHVSDPTISESGGMVQFSSDGTVIATFPDFDRTFLGVWKDAGNGWIVVDAGYDQPKDGGQGLRYWFPNMIVGDEIWYGDQLIMSRWIADLSDNPTDPPPAASPYGMP